MVSPLEQKLAEFRTKFEAEYKSQLAELIGLWRAARTDQQTEDVDAFLFSVHKLKGASGTLNFLNLSDRLGIIEQELYPCKDNISLLTKDLVTFVDRHMNALIAASKNSPDPMLTVVLDEEEKKQPDIFSEPVSEVSNHLSDTPKAKAKPRNYADISIVLIDDDKAVSALMSKLLMGFGFKIDYFESIEAFTAVSDTKQADLVLLDLVMPDVTEDEIFEFAKSQEDIGTVVYVLSSLNSFGARLAGVRANIHDYLLKPINITSLVSKIRKTFKIDPVKPHKILLLDDQAVIGNFYKTLLEVNGLEVKALTDPEQLFKSLEAFHPDVFLLDMHMPDVNGIEVAKVIRQIPKFDYIPIIFLTADTDLQTKLDALECGADDVIPKDISPAMIIDQISSRIIRGQEIRYLASRDSLTGVLNHGQIMDAAGQAFRLAKRNEKPINIAMIDLDNFKKVNDTYGHSGGDKVLVSLGQLLMQSIRDTDYVGRYGGEEFMVVFSDADTHVIEEKLNRIREGFNQIIFKMNDKSFMCSFSAGLACSKRHEKLNEMIASADKALYQAKDMGRNKVCSE